MQRGRTATHACRVLGAAELGRSPRHVAGLIILCVADGRPWQWDDSGGSRATVSSPASFSASVSSSVPVRQAGFLASFRPRVALGPPDP